MILSCVGPKATTEKPRQTRGKAHVMHTHAHAHTHNARATHIKHTCTQNRLNMTERGAFDTAAVDLPLIALPSIDFRSAPYGHMGQKLTVIVIVAVTAMIIIYYYYEVFFIIIIIIMINRTYTKIVFVSSCVNSLESSCENNYVHTFFTHTRTKKTRFVCVFGLFFSSHTCKLPASV